MAKTPNRYSLPLTAMVGAMAVVLALVVAMVLFRSADAGDESEPARSVDYHTWLKSGRADGLLRMFAPGRLPGGWRATSASYDTGVAPHWHLGLLTDGGHYVGLEEALASPRTLVHRYVDQEAVRGEPVRLAGHRWQTWTDSGGDYAVVRSMPAPKGREPEALLVVGSAPADQVRGFVASLHPSVKGP